MEQPINRPLKLLMKRVRLRKSLEQAWQAALRLRTTIRTQIARKLYMDAYSFRSSLLSVHGLIVRHLSTRVMAIRFVLA